MPQYKNPATITVGGLSFTFRASLLESFPEARAFIEDLQARASVSPSVMSLYVRLVARLRKQGRLDQPEKIVHNTERTAANAYHRWRGESYQARVQAVIRAFANDDVRRGIGWLRVGSVRPPVPGKVVPRLTGMGEIQLDTATLSANATPATFDWFPCDQWTLHVPRAEVATHEDPCLNCTSIELDAAKLEAIASAFEKAWGHRDIHLVPPECLLFGEPPKDWQVESAPAAEPTGKIVALVPRGAVASALSALRGAVTDDISAFDVRLKEGADVIVVSRSLLGDEHFEDIAIVVQSVVTEILRAVKQKAAGESDPEVCLCGVRVDEPNHTHEVP